MTRYFMEKNTGDLRRVETTYDLNMALGDVAAGHKVELTARPASLALAREFESIDGRGTYGNVGVFFDGGLAEQWVEAVSDNPYVNRMVATVDVLDGLGEQALWVDTGVMTAPNVHPHCNACRDGQHLHGEHPRPVDAERAAEPQPEKLRIDAGVAQDMMSKAARWAEWLIAEQVHEREVVENDLFKAGEELKRTKELLRQSNQRYMAQEGLQEQLRGYQSAANDAQREKVQMVEQLERTNEQLAQARQDAATWKAIADTPEDLIKWLLAEQDWHAVQREEKAHQFWEKKLNAEKKNYREIADTQVATIEVLEADRDELMARQARTHDKLTKISEKLTRLTEGL